MSTPRKKRWLLAGLLVLGLTGGSLYWRLSNREFEGLDVDAQDDIWQAEHVAFELETHFGRSFTAAWKERDSQQLRQFFRTPFRGAIPSTRTLVRSKAVVREQYCPGSGDKDMQDVDVDAFIDYLLGFRLRFQKIHSAGMRVLQNDQSESNAATWKLKVLLTLRGADDHGNPLHFESNHAVTAQFDDDDEIKNGCIVNEWIALDYSMRVSDGILMEEVTEQAGLNDLSLRDNWLIDHADVFNFRQQLAVADYDNDGWLDIAAATVEGKCLLLRNIAGQRFEDVAQSFGLPRLVRDRLDLIAAGWLDFDNDGFSDLIVGQRLFRNLEGRQFRDVTELSGLRIPVHCKGVVVADYDQDGFVDVYLVCDETGKIHEGKQPWVGDSVSGARNQLWRNEGNGQFRDVTHEAGADGGLRQSFAANWLYANDDALPDLYVANDFGDNLLLQNRGAGTFRDVPATSGIGDFATSMGVASGDLDNDGAVEIYVANMYSKMGRRIIAHVGASDYPMGVYEKIKGSCAGNRLYRRQPQGTVFHEVSGDSGINSVGWAFAPVMADYDSDGLLDLYATAGYRSFHRKKPDG